MDLLWSNYGVIIVVLGLVAVYAITYTINKKTPVPVEFIDITNNVACEGCKNFACSHKG